MLGSGNFLARKRDYDSLDVSKARSCREHKGRKGKVTGLCAGCFEEHLNQGNWKWNAPPYVRYAPVRPQEASGREDSPFPMPGHGQEENGRENGLESLGLVVLVCGSREWTDKLAIWDELFCLRDKVELVIHGGARGADSLAEEVARELGLPTRVYPADWDRFKPSDSSKGNPAAHIRDTRMLREGDPGLVLCFGEHGLVKVAEKAGVETRVVRPGDSNVSFGDFTH